MPSNKTYTYEVSFVHISDTHAEAYVNGEKVGNIKIKPSTKFEHDYDYNTHTSIKTDRRIPAVMFRSSSEAFNKSLAYISTFDVATTTLKHFDLVSLATHHAIRCYRPNSNR